MMARQTVANNIGTANANRRVVTTASSYGEAERAVDYLSDRRFPVERVAIVGDDVKMVEQVVGRLNYLGAVLRGAGSGALVGALIGWLFGLFNWVQPLIASITLAAYGLILGAVVGAIFGLIAHALQGGRRDFAAVRVMLPGRYDVMVDEEVADEAIRLLAQRDEMYPPPKRQIAHTRLQKAALITGVVFLVVGVAGFVPGVTTGYDTLQVAGHHSQAKLLGLFQVSVLHNLVHLVFGVAGLALARTAHGARRFLIGGGIVYLVLWLYGLLIDMNSTANFVPVNNADNWLNLLLGASMIGLGVVFGRRAVPVHHRAR
jgi:hypothetical protein